MATVRSAIRVAEGVLAKIDDRYDLTAPNAREIARESEGHYDAIFNAFRFGYAQALKAEAARRRREEKEVSRNAKT